MTHKEELELAFHAGYKHAYYLEDSFDQWYAKTYSTTPEKEILDYLSELSGTKYKHTKSNLAPIKARLNDGYTPDDLRKVIDNMVTEWGNTDMRKYLRPITLFRASKIDGYLCRTVRKPVSEMTDEELRAL